MKLEYTFFNSAVSNKETVIKEIKLTHHEYFESKLAAIAIDNPQLFTSVRKMSNAILGLIHQNYDSVFRLIESDKRITEELLNEKYFGRLDLSTCNNQPQAKEQSVGVLLEKIISTLENQQVDLTQVLQIHAAFCYRIYLNLPNKILPNSKLDSLACYNAARHTFPNDLFNPEKRGRFSKAINEPVLSTARGIVRNKARSKMLGEGTFHQRALDIFELDKSSLFYHLAIKENMPCIAGLSSHTKTFIHGALSYGEFSQEELLEYVFCCASFLITGGNHSFHEVMSVASFAGIPYIQGSYIECLPQVVLDYCNENLVLRDEFPEMFERRGSVAVFS
ncbi:MAG: hypothetical protein HKM04_07520 [Legionellales bacterium]|nr:hypothetical protein [Legionellales bacterium]